MQVFNTGATRDSAEGKLSYMRALSPAVLRRYVQYLAKHRKQADGNLRAFDNWKNGIPQDAYMDSLLRHIFDLWLWRNGCNVSGGNYDVDDLLCAIIFNASGMLFERMVDDGETTRECCTKPVVGGNTASQIEAEKPKTCGGDCEHYNGKHLCGKGRANCNADSKVVGCPDFTAKKVPQIEAKKPKTCGECGHFNPNKRICIADGKATLGPNEPVNYCGAATPKVSI